MNKNAALERLTSLEEEAKELRKIIETPENVKYPDGTFGGFSDNGRDSIFGYLGVPTSFTACLYGRYSNPELSDGGTGYKHFEPITEAILPIAIEHDGGEYPGNGDDCILIKREDGGSAPMTAKYCRWTKTSCDSDVKSYQLIKAS